MTLRVIRHNELSTSAAFVPTLTRHIFPDATPEQLRFLQVITDHMRETNNRMKALEEAAGLSGGEPLLARKGQQHIFGNALVHVDENRVAWLAVNTDAALYATHVAESVAVEQVRCIPLGVQGVRCLPFVQTGPFVYLSDQPGFATDAEPSPDGGSFVQLIGRKHGLRNDNNALCDVLFQPEIPGTGRGTDRDIDGGTYDERDVLIQVRRGAVAGTVPADLENGELYWDGTRRNLWTRDATTGDLVKVGGSEVITHFVSGVPEVGAKVGQVMLDTQMLASRQWLLFFAHAQDTSYGMDTGSSTILHCTFESTATGGFNLVIPGSSNTSNALPSGIDLQAVWSAAKGRFLNIFCTQSAGHGNISINMAME